ncbi:MAG: pyridoxal phosphate-dependent aminotransferase [Thermoplasmata archaeon]
MEFPPFEHLRFYEGVHDVRLNISFSNIKGFTLGEFHKALPKDLDLNWTDERGPPELRRLIARRSGVPMDRVLVTTGATEANFLAQTALLRPRDRVVVDSPIYSPLRDCATGLGARVVPVPRDCSDGWALDLDRHRKAAAGRARLLVFANLNNPTSAAIGRSELKELADLAEECDGYVVVDETFRDLAFRDAPPSVATLGPRMVALSTVTKVAGLGGLRVGWILADPPLLDRFKAVKDYTTVCGSSVSQLLGVWALNRWGSFRRRAKAILDRNRRIAREILEGMPGLRGEVPKSGSVMFPHSEVSVRKLTEVLLRRYRTVIAEGRFFGMDDHFRLGLGGDTKELIRGLGNVRKALRGMGG